MMLLERVGLESKKAPNMKSAFIEGADLVVRLLAPKVSARYYVRACDARLMSDKKVAEIPHTVAT
jgi:hypothetical protein